MDIQGFFSRWGWFLLLAAAALIGSYLLIGRKNNPKAAAGASLLPGAKTQPGANGQPVIEYVPETGDSYTNINYQQNSGNVTSTSSTVNNPLVPPPPAAPPPPHPNPIPSPIPTPGPHPVPTPAPVPVNRPPQPPRPTTPPPPTHPYVPYTIKWGDTLSKIAAEKHTTWQSLYNTNKGAIDTMSAKRHHPIPGGPWNNIWPGEVINVPA